MADIWLWAFPFLHMGATLARLIASCSNSHASTLLTLYFNAVEITVGRQNYSLLSFLPTSLTPLLLNSLPFLPIPPSHHTVHLFPL